MKIPFFNPASMIALRQYGKHLAVAFLMGVGICQGAAAQTPAAATADSVAAELSADEMTLEQALAEPEVPSKLNTFVKSYMKREAIALQKAGYKVETMRKGEIVIATIPTDKLFAPNDTVLLKSADSQLKPFLPYFKVPDKFKVVLAVHTDDTGTDDYLTSLCEKRIVALYDYFDSHASNTDTLTGYPLAANEPLKENNSRSNRAENRRLEIYIVPSTVLIEESKPAK
jgi:outer membrane protein OmpA-like peptidoglycan-associated protein